MVFPRRTRRLRRPDPPQAAPRRREKPIFPLRRPAPGAPAAGAGTPPHCRARPSSPHRDPTRRSGEAGRCCRL